MRGSPGPCLRRRPSPDRPEVLHELGLAQLRTQSMKLLLDFFPILLFFAAFKFAGIYAATAIAIVATILLIGQWVFKKNLLKSLMGAQMDLPEDAWRLTQWSWVGFSP